MADDGWGRLRFEWWLQCSRCGAETGGSGRMVSAFKTLRAEGWTYDRQARAWVCRACSQP